MEEMAPAMFIGGSPGLDFLNSIATPVDTPVDWIGDGCGLLDWLGQAALVRSDVLDTFRQAPPAELDGVAAQARELREWFRDFVREHHGRRLTADDLTSLRPLNDLLARDQAFGRIIVTDPSGPVPLGLERTRRWQSPESLLLPIATALAELVCAEDFSDVKACEGSACTLLFADHTRRRTRRWCSMALCGNRAKQSAHRDRQKTRRD